MVTPFAGLKVASSALMAQLKSALRYFTNLSAAPGVPLRFIWLASMSDLRIFLNGSSPTLLQ
ncbi:hypothetical protein ACFSE1_16365 [Rhizobium helianthi]|uniref:Uncharacterized protein n=1 Tax=Rhizobium helianthi TaxID=1132695 RepID=A0ABW4M6S9_9HYPH